MKPAVHAFSLFHPFASILGVASLAAVVLLAGDAHAQARRGSIYDVSRGPVSPVASKIAAKVGDLVTVVISESQDLKNEEEFRKLNKECRSGHRTSRTETGNSQRLRGLGPVVGQLGHRRTGSRQSQI